MSNGTTVGVIGVGQMGAAMSRTLLRKGWRVIAWDIAAGVIDAVVAAGAEAAANPAEVASRAAIILTSLPDAAAVRDCCFGPDGIVAAGARGSLLVETSTISPEDARTIAADLALHGINFVDAPLSGGVRGAEAGALSVMVGGAEDHLERAKAVLSTIGKAVVHCGPVGAGQITKACNQLVVMATHESVAEAMVLAQMSGLDPWRVREALMAGLASSPILEHQAPKMLTRDFAPGGKAVYHLKDISTITALEREAGIELPCFHAAARQIERLCDAGGGDLDNSAVVTVVEGSRRPSSAGAGDSGASR